MFVIGPVAFILCPISFNSLTQNNGFRFIINRFSAVRVQHDNKAWITAGLMAKQEVVVGALFKEGGEQIPSE